MNHRRARTSDGEEKKNRGKPTNLLKKKGPLLPQWRGRLTALRRNPIWMVSDQQERHTMKKPEGGRVEANRFKIGFYFFFLPNETISEGGGVGLYQLPYLFLNGN